MRRARLPTPDMTSSCDHSTDGAIRPVDTMDQLDSEHGPRPRTFGRTRGYGVGARAANRAAHDPPKRL